MTFRRQQRIAPIWRRRMVSELTISCLLDFKSTLILEPCSIILMGGQRNNYVFLCCGIVHYADGISHEVANCFKQFNIYTASSAIFVIFDGKIVPIAGNLLRPPEHCWSFFKMIQGQEKMHSSPPFVCSGFSAFHIGSSKIEFSPENMTLSYIFSIQVG